MNSMQLWLSATRPKTLFASLSPVLIGTFFSISDGHFYFPIFVLTLLTALMVQISTNFANDYFDGLKGTDTVKRKGPTRLIQAGLVTPSQMQIALFAVFSLTAILGGFLSYFGGPIIAILTGLSLILALVYTAGPWPLAYIGLGDVFVFVFFGPIATAFTYYLQTHTFTISSFIVGIIPGALSTAILIVNNLRDVEEDREGNKKTLAVRFGEEFAKKEYIATILMTYLTILGLSVVYPFALITLLTLPYALKVMLKVARNTNKPELNPCLFETGKLLLYITMLLCLSKML